MAINIEEKDTNINRISQVNIGGTTYSLKDTAARSALSAVEARVAVNEEHISNNADAIAGIMEAIKGGVSYLGKIQEILTDGATTSPVTLIKSDGSSEEITPVAGYMVHAKKSSDATKYDVEFIWDGTAWNELGSTSGLKDLAFKDEVTATYTPKGNVTVEAIAEATYDISNGSLTGKPATLQTTFAGTEATLQTTFAGTEATLQTTFTGTTISPTGTFAGSEYTPEGTVEVTTPKQSATWKGTAKAPMGTVAIDDITPAGSIADIKYTPKGSVADISYTPAGNVADIAYTPEGTVTGKVTVAGHSHTGRFTGEESTITSK